MLWLGGSLFTQQRKASENPGFFHFQNHFSFLVLPAAPPDQHWAYSRGTYSGGSTNEWGRSTLHLSWAMGSANCLSPRVPCPKPCLSPTGEKSHTLSWDGRSFPKGNNPHTVTRWVQRFWSDAAWRPDVVSTWGCSLIFRTYLEPGEKSFQGLLGCGDWEVTPESSIQAAATVLLQGPGQSGRASWLHFGISREAACSKCAQLAPVQFLPSHLCLDRCEVNAKSILASLSQDFGSWKVTSESYTALTCA